MTRVITIRLEIPEGVEVRIGGRPPDDDEPLPPPPWLTPGEPATAPTVTSGGRNGATPGVCPIHRLPWRSVPAGVSKRTGRPYDAFLACPEPGCGERPAVPRRAAS